MAVISRRQGVGPLNPPSGTLKMNDQVVGVGGEYRCRTVALYISMRSYTTSGPQVPSSVNHAVVSQPLIVNHLVQILTYYTVIYITSTFFPFPEKIYLTQLPVIIRKIYGSRRHRLKTSFLSF